MLMKIVFPSDQNEFNKCLDHIKNSYWPQELYLETVKELSVSLNRKTDVRKEIKIFLDDLVKKISSTELYVFCGDPETTLSFPFLDKLHKLFLIRQWDQDPSLLFGEAPHYKSLIRLEKEENGNYSKNAGNFKHFVNVVVATARLINFFSDKNKLKAILGQTSNEEHQNSLFDSLQYTQSDNQRIFRLMLTAYYHDIGKTIVDRRHGMEGSILLSDHTTQSWYALKCIATKYNAEFKHEDLLFISEALFFHDLFGILSTGECGFAKLAPLINSIRPFSDKTKPYSVEKLLFDIWLLNVADIIVSINYCNSSKYEFATWLNEDKDSVNNKINNFFSNNKGSILIHDYKVACELIDCIKNKKHSDDITNLEKEAYTHSRNHTIERINRLILDSLSASQESVQSIDDNNVRSFFENIKTYIERKNIEDINHIIIKSIKNHGDFQCFCNSLSFVGHMDYALGFFTKITKVALLEVVSEIKTSIDTKNGSTHWIRPLSFNSLGGPEDDDAKKEFWKIQSRFFMENLTSIFIQILTHVIHRETTFDSFRNLEFGDASERLTEEKIQSIIYLKGPAWSKRVTRGILQCIFYW